MGHLCSQRPPKAWLAWTRRPTLKPYTERTIKSQRTIPNSIPSLFARERRTRTFAPLYFPTFALFTARIGNALGRCEPAEKRDLYLPPFFGERTRQARWPCFENRWAVDSAGRQKLRSPPRKVKPPRCGHCLLNSRLGKPGAGQDGNLPPFFKEKNTHRRIRKKHIEVGGWSGPSRDVG